MIGEDWWSVITAGATLPARWCRMLALALSRAKEFYELSQKAPSIPRRVKLQILREAHGQPCPSCGCKMIHLEGRLFGEEQFCAATVGHILPKALGGQNKSWNLRATCNLCNRASGQAMNEWLQENRNGPMEDRERLVKYLWSEIDDPSKADKLYPDFYISFLTKRGLILSRYDV